MAEERLDPDGDAQEDWVPTPATSDEWTRCNDGSDLTYISTVNDWYTERFTFDDTSDASGQTINFADWFFRAKSSTDNDDVRAACKVGAENSEYSGDIPIANAGVAEYSYEWTNNPVTTDPWTSALLDDTQFGINARDITGEMFCYQMWVIVDYTAAGGPTIPIMDQYYRRMRQ